MVSAFDASQLMSGLAAGQSGTVAEQPDDPDIGQQWAMHRLGLFRQVYMFPPTKWWYGVQFKLQTGRLEYC